MSREYNGGDGHGYNDGYDNNGHDQEQYGQEYYEGYDENYDGGDEEYYDPEEQYEQEQYQEQYDEEQYYDEQYDDGGDPRESRGKRKKTMKIVAVVLAALIVLVGCAIAVFAISLNNWKNNPMDAFEDIDPDNQIQLEEDTAYSLSQDYNDKLVVFVLIGLDSSAERDLKNMGARADTMVVCVVDTEKKTAKMLTLPRDTKTQVNHVDANGKVTSTVTGKLNAAFPYGGGAKKYGYSNTCYAISKVLFLRELGIPEIKLAVGMNLDGIVPLADALGGVPVKLERDYPGFGEKGDVITLKGKDAEAFIRTRKGVGLTGSDIVRTEHQYWFLKGVARKIKEMGPIQAVPTLYSQLSSTLQTNMEINQMGSLALVLDAMDLDTVTQYTLPGKDVHEKQRVWYYYQDEEATKQMVKEIFYE